MPDSTAGQRVLHDMLRVMQQAAQPLEDATYGIDPQGQVYDMHYGNLRLFSALLTETERRRVAQLMIARWQRWAAEGSWDTADEGQHLPTET